MTMHPPDLVSTPTLGRHGLTIIHIFYIARFGVSSYECGVRIYVYGKDPESAVLGTRASNEARPKFPKQTQSRSSQSLKDW